MVAVVVDKNAWNRTSSTTRIPLANSTPPNISTTGSTSTSRSIWWGGWPKPGTVLDSVEPTLWMLKGSLKSPKKTREATSEYLTVCHGRRCRGHFSPSPPDEIKAMYYEVCVALNCYFGVRSKLIVQWSLFSGTSWETSEWTYSFKIHTGGPKTASMVI